jgi:hypothetical protein
MMELITSLLASLDVSAVGDLVEAGWRIAAAYGSAGGEIVEAGLRNP